jgi:hypothetical protein
MENPATWGPVERAISEALRDADEARSKRLIGLSTVRRIADKLRERGLIDEGAVATARMNEGDTHDRGTPG